jgi:hypothetical protein
LHFHNDEETGFQHTLTDVARFLALSSRRRKHDYGLPEPVEQTREVAEEFAYLRSNHHAFVAESDDLSLQLNEEQSHVFQLLHDTIVTHEAHRVNTMFFIEGRPGRGKTFLIRALTAALRAQSIIVLIVGTSALSAIAYHRGRTAHYLFGIPVTDNNVDLHSSISPFSPRADLIREAAAIIWDELPMANKAAWECAHRLCCDIMQRNDRPFGGKVVIGSGDFRQVSPVVPGSGEFATLTASVKTSLLWQHMQLLTLNTPIRTLNDPTFTRLIDAIGEDCSHARQTLPFLNNTKHFDDAVDFLFPPEILADPVLSLDRAFLSPRNIFVDAFNECVIDAIPGELCMLPLFLSIVIHCHSLLLFPVHLFSSDSLKEADHVAFDSPEQTPEYLAMLRHPGVPPHQLDLKINSICALQRNLSVEKGLVHNARVRVVNIHRCFVEVAFPNDIETHCIPRITFNFTPAGSDWTVSRKQFPLRLAYATTFNGCQGLTLSRSVIDLRIDSFAHGQLYTALSRVRNKNDSLLLFSESNAELSTANLVYKSLLL